MRSVQNSLSQNTTKGQNRMIIICTGWNFKSVTYKSVLKPKDNPAPTDRPSARKKVMRAPVVSLSCGNTFVGAKHMGRDTK